MPKNQYTHRDELVCGKLDQLREMACKIENVPMVDLIDAVRHDCERMEAKLISRKNEALTRTAPTGNADVHKTPKNVHDGGDMYKNSGKMYTFDADVEALAEKIIQLVETNCGGMCSKEAGKKAYRAKVKDLLTAHVAKHEVWQDISTAPKDGTGMLVYCPETNKRCLAAYDPDGTLYNVSDHAFEEGDATHWMPLPATPKTGEV